MIVFILMGSGRYGGDREDQAKSRRWPHVLVMRRAADPTTERQNNLKHDIFNLNRAQDQVLHHMLPHAIQNLAPALSLYSPRTVRAQRCLNTGAA